ncbi:MAG: MraY family glycosyltransferase [Oligoflexales bacterium]
MFGGWEAFVTLEFLLVFSTALILSFASTPGLIRLGHQFHFLDIPDSKEKTDSLTIPRKVHSNAIPRIGGLSIIFGFFLSSYLWDGFKYIGGIFPASVILFVTGFFDDIRPLPASFRLFIQIFSASAAVYVSGLALNFIGLTPEYYIELPSWVGFTASVFIIVGAINAINLIDGLDGLAGGVVFIGVALLSYSHFLITRDYHILVLLSFPIMGALLGFLRFNTHPASIFMGDGGSSWLGFMVGILMLITLNKVSFESGAKVMSYLPITKMSPAVPITSVVLCLSIPVFDTFLVILGRLKRRQSPLKPDRNHFHHHLLRLGLNQSQSVVAIYFIALVSGIAGIAPIAFPRYELWWTPWFAMIFVPCVMIIVGKTGGEVLNSLLITRSTLSHHRRIGPNLKLILRYWEGLNRYTIYALLGLTPFFAGVPPRALGLAASFASMVVFFTLFLPSRRMDFLQHLMITFGATVLLAAINVNNLSMHIYGKIYNVQYFYNSAYIVLFISTLLHILITFRKNYLQVSPTDFLLVTVPLLLLLVPEPWNSQYRLSIISMRALILFMAMRTLVKRQFTVLRRIKTIILVSLVFLMAVSLLELRFVYLE